jgi:hypothetical protein
MRNGAIEIGLRLVMIYVGKFVYPVIGPPGQKSSIRILP